MIEMDESAMRTRRAFFGSCGVNLSAMALSSLLGGEARASTAPSRGTMRPATDSMTPRSSHLQPRCKQVIFLFMIGGPSQHDLFLPKPELNRRAGELLPQSFLSRAKFAQIQDKQPRLMGTPWKFSRHGDCGATVSELLPHTASIVDRLAILQAVKTDDLNHAFAELEMNTGWRKFGRPSLGSWVVYGLGSEANDLPGFVVLQTGLRPRSKSGNYGNGFLPSVYQGVPLRSSGAPILNLESPDGFTPGRQERTIRTINALNRERLARTGDPEIAARISSYEMAFRMQAGASELFDLDGETAATLNANGIRDPAEPSFARNCLLARRLVERGVRFVQLFHGDWDHHTNIARRLPQCCRETDQASAALVNDLARRGLLENTLVVWGGELGRTPVAQTGKKESVGRDHNIDAFTMWLAGGGVKPGQTIGTTDDFGYFPTSDSVHVYDLQSTILHLLGLDHKRLTYRYQGRDFRLTDVHGNVVQKLVS
jgi:hypothetical protein